MITSQPAGCAHFRLSAQSGRGKRPLRNGCGGRRSQEVSGTLGLAHPCVPFSTRLIPWFTCLKAGGHARFGGRGPRQGRLKGRGVHQSFWDLLPPRLTFSWKAHQSCYR